MISTLLDLLTQKGSTWVTRADFKSALARANKTDSVAKMCEEDKIISCIKRNNTIFTLPCFFRAENNIVANYYRLQKKTAYSEKFLRNLINEAQKHLGISLHEQQIKGIENALINNVSIITGGAGTGKTSVLLALMYCLKKINPSIRFALTAPTGKASRRMSEATGMEAYTLHKKLGLTEESSETDFYLAEDAIIVDEFSMVDLLLAEQLFKAVKTGAKLIMVGDVNQLASVGVGTVMRSLISCKVIPLTMLTKTFRQDDSSTLFRNITAIKEGGKLESGNDFKLMKNNGATQKMLIDIYNVKCQEYGRDNVVILLPYRRVGDTCTEVVNRIIQAQAHHNKSTSCCIVDSTHKFYVGDPVIQMENREVANGEVGKVITVTSEDITVKFEDCEIIYEREEILNNISLAYAITIHKSQGSEYPCVICSCLNNEIKMQSKNLLYTGVTRAKKECILIYDEPALSQALKKEEDASRISMLEDKFAYTKRYMEFNQQALCSVV